MGFRFLCRKGAFEILTRKAGGGGGRMMSTATNPTPWLMLPPTFDRSRGGMVYNFYSLADDEVLLFNKYGGGPDPIESPDDDARAVGSSHGWLALMNRRNNDLFLSNPLSRRHIKLPPIENLPDPVFNLCYGGSVSKLIVSASPDSSECRAMMSFGPGDRLAFCLPGRSREWTPIGDLFVDRLETADTKCARVYEDFLYSSRTNLFNCLTSFGTDSSYYYSYEDSKLHDEEGSELLCLEDWDLRDAESPRIDWIQTETVEGKPRNNKGQTLPDFDCGWLDDVELSRCSIMKHLVYVEERNEVLLLFRLIRKRPRATVGFVAAKVIKESGGRMRLVGSSLEGLAVFVGTNNSFAAETAGRGFLKPNSVYFTDHKIYVGKDDEDGGGDVGIFNCGDGTFSSCYYPRSPNQRIVPAPIWFNPTLP